MNVFGWIILAGLAVFICYQVCGIVNDIKKKKKKKSEEESIEEGNKA